MILYHGTNQLNLNYLKKNSSKKDNDFGKGVYLTTDLKQAKNWALRKGNGKGAIYKFEIDLEKENLNILVFDGNEEECNYIYYLCRNKTEDIVNEIIPDWKYVDIIIGPMIGNSDTYKKNIKSFHGENISFLSTKYMIKSINYNPKFCILTFNDLTKTKKMWGNQYCFKSKKAIELLNKKFKKVIYLKKSNN